MGDLLPLFYAHFSLYDTPPIVFANHAPIPLPSDPSYIMALSSKRQTFSNSKVDLFAHNDMGYKTKRELNYRYKVSYS